MIEHLAAQDLAMIARNGGSLEVNGGAFTADDLAMIARNLKEGSFLKVLNSGSKTAQDMAMIARNGRTIFA